MADSHSQPQVYFKDKHIYILVLSQYPHHIAFQNIKASVAYINRLSLFQDQPLVDYYHVVDQLRSGKSWNYLSEGLVLKLSQVLVYGKKVKSAKKAPVQRDPASIVLKSVSRKGKTARSARA